MQTLKLTDIPSEYIIFDMDGVLVNSAPITRKAAKIALAELGISAESIDFTKYAGTGEKNFITGPCRDFNKSEFSEIAIKRLYEIFAENVQKEITVFPMVRETLLRLKEMNYPIALASSSATEKIAQTLAAAEIKTDWFDVIISGDEVSETKPSPQIFNAAISRLGATPDKCLIVEDAVSGVLAAKAAKAKCFAVANTFPKEKLTEVGADFAGDRIDELFEYLPKKGEV